MTIKLPDEVMTTDEITFNMDSKIGELKHVRGLVQPSIIYEAQSVVRKDEELYSLNKAWITSCNQPVPRWKFSCSRADFRKNDHVAMWNAVFSIKKIPIFYLPYMRYPLDKERSTGFLIPKLGYTGRKGMIFSQAFFWAIRGNMDATVHYDYFSARGMGGGLQYRYLFTKGVGGQLDLYYFRFNKSDELLDLTNAYILRFKHNQPLPANVNLVADVDYQSSYDFLREFDNDFRRAVVSNRRSQIFLSRAWSYFNLNMRMSRFETYNSMIESSIIRQSLPELGFNSTKIKLISPFYFSFNSGLSRWEYGWNYQYEKGRQKKGQDFSFSPTLTVPFTSIPWLTLNSAFSGHFIYYFQSYSPNTTHVVSEPLLRRDYSVNVQLTGPAFFKVFNDSDNQPKFKHLIEPTLTYRYESPVTDSDRIITSSFYFFRNHYIKYGLNNSVQIKEEKGNREIFSLNIFQSLYLEPEESPLSPFLVDGEIPKFSDITGQLRFYPARSNNIDVSAGFNPYFKTFSSLRLSASLGMPSDPFFGRLSWFKGINPYRPEAIWARHQISFYGGGKIPALSMDVLAAVDFNIQERKLQYSALSWVYHYQCLDFKADLKIFYFREKPEFQFGISFGLGNIGKTTEFLGGMDY